MKQDAFSPISTLRFPTASRVFTSSWCPDKDLLLIASRSPSGDKLSLWKMQGSKKWEFEFDKASTATGGIVDVVWSPDGTFIAVAHHPATVTLHSVQDGAQHNIMFPRVKAGLPDKPNICGIWWFKRRDTQRDKSMPDLLRRNDLIPGSALSVLQSQPLLDTLYDETHAMSTSDLFSFQSTSPRNPPRYLAPQVVANWPSLHSDLPAATLRSKKVAKQKQRPGEDLDEPDDANQNSILVVADQSGNVWSYLDGSFPLGFVSLGLDCTVDFLDTDRDTTFFVYLQALVGDQACTGLCPVTIRLPLLKERLPRDVAKVSTAVKDLTYFALCVVKEMKTAWFGSDTYSGAKEWGIKWIKDLEKRQRDQFGIKEPHAILDLTTLLVTGRASESLADFLGSGEQMSERGIQKWESAVLEALVRIRDYSEKLLIPATQRLYILLLDVRGWGAFPQYSHLQINVNEVSALLIILTRAIVCASWLSAAARKEFARFIEFVTWIRHETSRANQQADVHNHPSPRHDILEVNEYFMSGLVSSSITRWFTGPTPTFQPTELGIVNEATVDAAVTTVRDILDDPNGLTNFKVKVPDTSSMSLNIDSLFTDFSGHARRMFHQACQATSRAAIVSVEPRLRPTLGEANPRNLSPEFSRQGSLMIHDGASRQYLVIQSPHVGEQSYLCLIQITTSQQTPPDIIAVTAAPLQCCIAREGESVTPLEILDAEFFDEQAVIVVYRARGQTGPTYVGTVNYVDLHYQQIHTSWDVKCNSRESLMLHLLQLLEHGQLASAPLPITARRALGGCREGKATVSVNGRVGRRVVCVLDDAGLSLEILDMEGEAAEDADSEEAEEEAEDSMDASAD